MCFETCQVCLTCWHTTALLILILIYPSICAAPTSPPSLAQRAAHKRVPRYLLPPCNWISRRPQSSFLLIQKPSVKQAKSCSELPGCAPVDSTTARTESLKTAHRVTGLCRAPACSAVSSSASGISFSANDKRSAKAFRLASTSIWVYSRMPMGGEGAGRATRVLRSGYVSWVCFGVYFASVQPVCPS